MAYDPVTGEYKEEESDVSKKITGLLSKDDKYMQQAGTRGKQQANKRGLLNSSMGVGAVESARIDAALPIASQDASQAHQRNMQGRDIQFGDISQQRDIDSRKSLLQMDITSREGMQGRDIASREYMQGRDIESREGMQAADITSREGMQGRDIESREGMHARDIESREYMQGQELSSREFMQQNDITSREGMQALELDSRERVAGMNIEANNQNAAAGMASNIDSAYVNYVTSIMNNPDIPAAERQRLLDNAADHRDSSYALLEQIFGVDLEWDDVGTGGGETGPPQETDSRDQGEQR